MAVGREKKRLRKWDSNPNSNSNSCDFFGVATKEERKEGGKGEGRLCGSFRDGGPERKWQN